MGCMIRRIDKTINCPVPRLVPRSSSQFPVPSYHMDQNCHMHPGFDLHGRSAAHSPVGSRRGNSNAVQTPRRNGYSYSVYQSVLQVFPTAWPQCNLGLSRHGCCAQRNTEANRGRQLRLQGTTGGAGVVLRPPASFGATALGLGLSWGVIRISQARAFPAIW